MGETWSKTYVREPTKDRRYTTVQTSSHEERHAVLDLVVVGVCDHSISDDRQRQRTQHDGSSDAVVVGNVRGTHYFA